MSDTPYLLLKWGTVKGWGNLDTNAPYFEKLNQYLEDMPLSCAADRPNEERKKLLCEVIDLFDGEISNNYSGDTYTKEQAKQYIMEYANG